MTTESTIGYLTDSGERATMPDHPVEFVEVASKDALMAMGGCPLGEFIPIDDPTSGDREEKIDRAKRQLLGRFTLRAKHEKANRATYTYYVGPCCHRELIVLLHGRLD